MRIRKFFSLRYNLFFWFILSVILFLTSLITSFLVNHRDYNHSSNLESNYLNRISNDDSKRFTFVLPSSESLRYSLNSNFVYTRVYHKNDIRYYSIDIASLNLLKGNQLDKKKLNSIKDFIQCGYSSEKNALTPVYIRWLSRNEINQKIPNANIEKLFKNQMSITKELLKDTPIKEKYFIIPSSFIRFIYNHSNLKKNHRAFSELMFDMFYSLENHSPRHPFVAIIINDCQEDSFSINEIKESIRKIYSINHAYGNLLKNLSQKIKIGIDIPCLIKNNMDGEQIDIKNIRNKIEKKINHTQIPLVFIDLQQKKHKNYKIFLEGQLKYLKIIYNKQLDKKQKIYLVLKTDSKKTRNWGNENILKEYKRVIEWYMNQKL